ncbi:hypothetical protein A8H35_01715 [Burkholderia thailandensis]|nr:hypothetical protein A8H35_01715 [Burkholderia thailandensis]AWY68495.1 hypothetical protein A8H36_26660 [Burkholderia thailandensis]
MTPGRARCPPAGLPAKRATLAFVVAREAKYGRDPVTQFAGDAAGRRDAHRDAWRLICLSQGTLEPSHVPHRHAGCLPARGISVIICVFAARNRMCGAGLPRW